MLKNFKKQAKRKVAVKGAEIGLGVVQKKAKNDKIKTVAGKALKYLDNMNSK